MKIRKIDRLIFIIIALALAVTILENSLDQGPVVTAACHVLDFAICFLFIAIFFFDLLTARHKLNFIKQNIFESIFVLFFILLFAYTKCRFFFVGPYGWHNVPTKLILAISLFSVFKILLQMKRLNVYFRTLTAHPAQTIALSFFIVILVGTILLMMPFSSADGSRLGFVTCIFTATSATCVTGLTVLDTATAFSFFGKIIILLLIQIGGLGIMILASFAAFLVGRKLSFQDRLAMSYMLDENDTQNIMKAIKNIVLLTFFFELCGAILLFPAFRGAVEGNMRTAFFSVFHAVSAFCNAGFALFSDNLEQFRSSATINFVIAGLIISGGISFAVITNSFRHFRTTAKNAIFGKTKKIEKLTLNTKVVLLATVILITAGTLLIYRFELKDHLVAFDLKTQYLSAFFQSVTLRTAGFNTLDISNLHRATYALMILFMFIGGASGSTAGGVKVNSVAVVWAYVKSVFKNEDETVLMKHSISKNQIGQAFLVIFLSLLVVFVGTVFLSLSENKQFVKIVFEVVSAFGTVGLSTGITNDLSAIGKLVIALIMFIGRLGPLTIITALSRKTQYYGIKYPEAKISIG